MDEIDWVGEGNYEIEIVQLLPFSYIFEVKRL